MPTNPPGLTGPVGYPELQTPQTRVTHAYKSFWTQLRVNGPGKAHRAQQAVNATRAVVARRRK